MNSSIMIGIIVFVFAADIGWQIYQNKRRGDLLRQLDACLSRKDYAAFDELIESEKVRKSFPLFNINFMKLNEAMYKEDTEEIEKAFDSFDMHMNKVQKEALYRKGFYYYVGIEDKQKSEYYYNQLKQLDLKDQENLDMTYDIYVLNGYLYLDRVNEIVKNLSGEQQMPYLALLSDMYRNKGDLEKADEYEKKVLEYTEKLKK